MRPILFKTILATSAAALLPSLLQSQTITVYNDRTAFETAMAAFQVKDNFALEQPFFDYTTGSGAISSGKWLDVVGQSTPVTTWETAATTTAWGGTWDLTPSGTGGGISFNLDFGGGNIVTVPSNIPGGTPGSVFFGFIADQSFQSVRVSTPTGASLQETYTMDDLTVSVPSDWLDVQFTQGGSGAWDTAGHWDTGLPGINQRVFIQPTGGTVVSGPTAPTSVRQLYIGNGTNPSQLNLNSTAPLTINGGYAVIRNGSTLGGAGQLDGKLMINTGGTLSVADGQLLQAGNAQPNAILNSGNIAIGTGTLVLQSGSAIPLGAQTTLAGGTLTASGNSIFISAGDVLSGRGLLNGAFTLQSTGTLRANGGTLTANNLSVTGGTVEVTASSTLTSTLTSILQLPTTTVGAGGTINAAGELQLLGTTTLAAGSVLHGSQGLVLDSSSLTHTGANTFDGGTGSITIRKNFALNNGDILNGTQVRVEGNGVRLMFAANSDLAGSAVNQIVLDQGGLHITGATTLDASKSISVAAAGGNIVSTEAVTIAGNISGPGRLMLSGTFAGANTYTLTGANTQAGGLHVLEEAELAIDNDSRIGGVNGTFDFGHTNGFSFSGGKLLALAPLNIPATRISSFVNWIVNTNGFDVTFNQPITGLAGEFIKVGSGTLFLNGQNLTIDPVSTNILEGSVQTGRINALGPTFVGLSASTTLNLAGFDQSIQQLNGEGLLQLGGAHLTITNFGSYFTGIIAGNGGVTLQNASALFTGANTFTGGMRIEDSNFGASGDASFGDAAGTITLDSGRIYVDFSAFGDITLPASRAITIEAGTGEFGAFNGSLIIDGTIDGAGKLVAESDGNNARVVRLNSNNNSFLGGTDVNAGILEITGDGSLGAASGMLELGTFENVYIGDDMYADVPIETTLRILADTIFNSSRPVRLDGHGKLDTNGFDLTIPAGITSIRTGSGIIKTGSGTLYLNGANTYNGLTDVQSGTLSGTGTIKDVTVRSLAALAPGNSPGILNTEDVIFEIDSWFELEFDSPVSADQLNVTGNITLQGDVQLSLTLGYTPTGETFTIIQNDGIDAINTGGGFFALGGNQLTEGELFTYGPAEWTISYIGGTGNDVTLTVVPEPTTSMVLLSGLALLTARRRQRLKP